MIEKKRFIPILLAVALFGASDVPAATRVSRQ